MRPLTDDLKGIPMEIIPIGMLSAEVEGGRMVWADAAVGPTENVRLERL